MNYLIYGTSYNLIDNEIRKLIGDKTYKTYTLGESTLEEVLEDVGYSGLFEEEKILVIKNFSSIFDSKKDNTKILDNLFNYLKQPNQLTTIIFVSDSKINEKTKINKEILSKLKIITTVTITKPYELVNFLGNYIKGSGYAISSNALNIFANKCVSNIDIAIMEFNKLKLIKKDNKLITENDVLLYVSNYNTNDLFGFKDALINKDLGKSFRMLDEIEASKMEIIPIVAMLESEFEMLYNVKALSQEKLNNEQIGERLDKMHPYRVKMLREAGNKYTLDDLKKHILYLCNLDLKMVSEDNLGFDEIRKFMLTL